MTGRLLIGFVSIAAMTMAMGAVADIAMAEQKPLGKMTGEDFLGLDEVIQPKAAYWAVAYGQGGKPEAAVLDVDATEQLVPVIIEECKKARRSPSGRR
ncbi:MAG TPA: HdeA/HdeB family chaperone [Nitrospiria bacterium]|nr:HdeA/HdeB family chaperone [Nitrospiria bacterium]